MGSSTDPPEHEEFLNARNFQIPFDLFVSKKHKLGLVGRSCIDFKDSSGNLVFKAERPPNNHKNQSTRSSQPNPSIKLLLDASGNSLFSIHKPRDAVWQCFRMKDSREEVICRVEKKVDKLTRTEFEMFLMGEKAEETNNNLKMRGSPFKRSCTIYNGDSIVAETSLMYQLGFQKAFVPRSRFRVTIFPGHCDVGLILAMVLIFFDGRKLWI